MAWPYSSLTPTSWQQPKTTTTRPKTTTTTSGGYSIPNEYEEQSSLSQTPQYGSPGTYTYGGGTTTSAPAPTLGETFDQGAFDAMMVVLNQYGLGSLATVLKNLILEGITDEASLMLRLQETAEWKARFIGNEILRQKFPNMPVLSIPEYLAAERAYAQIMKSFGLPADFYDSYEDFGQWIGNNVSPAELNERVQAWADLVNREDPNILAQLESMGMNKGDLLAYYMDPERANPLLQRKYRTILIGASARRVGLATDNAYAEYLAGMGITEQQAQAGYAFIGEWLPATDKLGDIFREDYAQRDFESEVFEGNAASTRKRKRLASRERAEFSGGSGIVGDSLRQNTAGQF